MKFKRLFHTIMLSLMPGGRKRASYLKKHNVFASVGDNVCFQPRYIPIYPELIRLHNNIVIARKVDFVTHDAIHSVLNRLPAEERGQYKFGEHIGCIEIMDNVFVGSHSVIMSDIRIGPDVIIASGSIVTKNCEPDSVYAGVPARKIGTMHEYIKKRADLEIGGGKLCHC